MRSLLVADCRATLISIQGVAQVSEVPIVRY